MPHILVVEDDPDLSALITLVVERLGHHVTAVPDGLPAVDLAATGDFDAVVLDFHMPYMNGAEATTAIRSLPQCADLPIILLTASASHAEITQALAAGVDAYVAKPFLPKDLRVRLDDLLQHGRPTNRGPADQPR